MRRLLLLVALALVLAVAYSGPVFADAGEQANCIGKASSTSDSTGGFNRNSAHAEDEFHTGELNQSRSQLRGEGAQCSQAGSPATGKPSFAQGPK
jgi:hypothetical protein